MVKAHQFNLLFVHDVLIFNITLPLLAGLVKLPSSPDRPGTVELACPCPRSPLSQVGLFPKPPLCALSLGLKALKEVVGNGTAQVSLNSCSRPASNVCTIVFRASTLSFRCGFHRHQRLHRLHRLHLLHRLLLASSKTPRHPRSKPGLRPKPCVD